MGSTPTISLEYQKSTTAHILVAFDLRTSAEKENFDCLKFSNHLPNATALFAKKMEQRPLETISLKLIDEVACELKLECLTDGKKMSKRNVKDTQKLCFEAILIMLYNKKTAASCITTKEAFIARYPEFSAYSDLELYTLMVYRNVMASAVNLVPSASGHKNHFLDLTTRITEGHTVVYITGSGETNAAKNRILIFRREGNVRLVNRGKKLNEAIQDEKLFSTPSALDADSEQVLKRARLTVDHVDQSEEDDEDAEENSSEAGDSSYPYNDTVVNASSSAHSLGSFYHSIGKDPIVPAGATASSLSSLSSPWDSIHSGY